MSPARHPSLHRSPSFNAISLTVSSSAILLAVSALAGCATAQKLPAIAYDDLPTRPAILTPEPLRPVQVVAIPTPLPLPGQLMPAPPSPTATSPSSPARPVASGDPTARVARANMAARIQPDRGGWVNAIQLYPWTDGALYQVYAAPGEVTDIALQAGEQLTGAGPVAAGDTVRWVIGDTTSGSGATLRVHILVKPTAKDLVTNLVINTDRRTYHIELRATAATYLASVSWTYPQDQLIALRGQSAAATAAAPIAAGIDLAALDFRYRIEGDAPPWRPLRAFDDGTKVYIEFPSGIAQGDLPPLFVIGAARSGELVNYRVSGRHMIVDRLFAAAELRLGDKKSEQTVRIVRDDGRAPGKAGR